MNTIQRAQEKFDGRLPPPVSTSPRQIARQEWLHNAAELLVVFRSDVRVQRRVRPAQVVTQDQFALAVDEHVNGRLADCKVNTSALGWLVLAAQHQRGDKAAATELLGNSVHPQGMLWEIAERLLEPLADDALVAQAEDELL